MVNRWAALVALGYLPILVACGSDSEPGASSGSAGTSPAGGTGGGAGMDAGGTAGGSSAGSAGSAGSTAAVACMDVTTNHASGTRIRGRFAITAEGDRSWRGWWDTE